MGEDILRRFENPPDPDKFPPPNFDSVVRPVPENEVPNEAAILLEEIREKYAAAVGEQEMSSDEQKTILTTIMQELVRERPQIRLALFDALNKLVEGDHDNDL